MLSEPIQVTPLLEPGTQKIEFDCGVGENPFTSDVQIFVKDGVPLEKKFTISIFG